MLFQTSNLDVIDWVVYPQEVPVSQCCRRPVHVAGRAGGRGGVVAAAASGATAAAAPEGFEFQQAVAREHGAN